VISLLAAAFSSRTAVGSKWRSIRVLAVDAATVGHVWYSIRSA
jgi:hypothetical protein